MPGHFDPRATTQAAALLLHLAGGRMRLEDLVACLGRADGRQLCGTGMSFTGATMIRSPVGPLPEEVLRALREPGSCSYWSAHIERSGEEASLFVDPGDEHLSEYTSETLHTVFEQHAREPAGSTPFDLEPSPRVLVSPEEILRASEMPDEEVRLVLELIEEHEAIEALFDAGLR
jgi:hypothetical protein